MPNAGANLVAKTWAGNGIYVDAHRRGEGHAAIDPTIEQAQRQFPAGDGRFQTVTGFVDAAPAR